jgi:TonB family protein
MDELQALKREEQGSPRRAIRHDCRTFDRALQLTWLMQENKAYFGALILSLIHSAQANNDRGEVASCQPIPHLLHYEVLPDDRESLFPHRGRVRLSFIIDRIGHVRDVQIEESSDDWFNELSVQSVLRWRYQPQRVECRATTIVKFTTKN